MYFTKPTNGQARCAEDNQPLIEVVVTVMGAGCPGNYQHSCKMDPERETGFGLFQPLQSLVNDNLDSAPCDLQGVGP